MSAPHLPQRKPVREFRRLTLVAVVVLIALSASVAGTLATIAWLAPQGGQSGSIVMNTLRPSILSQAEQNFDPFIEQQVRQRIFFVYDIAQKTQSGGYLPDAYKGPAAILNAEGWAVLYDPTYRRGEERRWDVITGQGSVYSVSQTVFDDLTGLVYFNVDADGFRGDISFVEWDSFDASAAYFSFAKDHIGVVQVNTSVPGEQKTDIPIWSVAYTRPLEGVITVGDLIVSENGSLVGIADAQQQLIESWRIASQLQSLFAEGRLVYSGIPVRGSYINAYQKGDMVVQAHGFAVTRSLQRATSSTLATGDIVLGIEGNTFIPASFARTIALETDAIEFDILRDNNIQTVTVSLQQVQP